MKKSNQIHQLLRVFFFLKVWFNPTLFTNTLTHTKQQKRVKYTHVHEWHAPTHSHQRSHAFWAIYNVATSERLNCVKRCSRILSKDKFYDTTMDHWSVVTHLALIAASDIAVSENSGATGSACSNDPLDMFFVFESYILYMYFAHTETHSHSNMCKLHSHTNGRANLTVRARDEFSFVWARLSHIHRTTQYLFIFFIYFCSYFCYTPIRLQFLQLLHQYFRKCKKQTMKQTKR